MGTSSVDATFTIRINGTNNEQEFRGIEIFYKLYGSSELSLETNLSTPDELFGHGFRPLVALDDEPGRITKPLLTVPLASRGLESSITIDFKDIDHPFVAAQPLEAGGYDLSDFEMKRFVEDIFGDFKEFSDMDPLDEDLSHISQDFFNDQDLQLLLYGLSYGKKDIATDAYSKAVCLFDIAITVPSLKL
jgi:hypothetical protein